MSEPTRDVHADAVSDDGHRIGGTLKDGVVNMSLHLPDGRIFVNHCYAWHKAIVCTLPWPVDFIDGPLYYTMRVDTHASLQEFCDRVLEAWKRNEWRYPL